MTTLAGRSVLVTGGAGFIGSHLVDALVAEGARVRVLDDFSSGCRENLASAGPGVDIVHGDVCDDGALDRALPGVEVVMRRPRWRRTRGAPRRRSSADRAAG